MILIFPHHARMLHKSKARRRILEQSKSTKASVIFNLVNEERDDSWAVIDGKLLENEDWELFAMNNNNGELNILLLSEYDGYVIRDPECKTIEVNL